MGQRNRFYVGHKNDKLVRIITKVIPIGRTHGHLKPVIGPFRTRKGMDYFVRHGYKHFDCRTVHDAEMLSHGYKWDLANFRWS